VQAGERPRAGGAVLHWLSGSMLGGRTASGGCHRAVYPEDRAVARAVSLAGA